MATLLTSGLRSSLSFAECSARALSSKLTSQARIHWRSESANEKLWFLQKNTDKADAYSLLCAVVVAEVKIKNPPSEKILQRYQQRLIKFSPLSTPEVFKKQK